MNIIKEKTKESIMLKLILSLILILLILTTTLSSFAFTVGERIVVKEGTKVPTLMKFGEMYILCSLAEVYKDGNKYFAYCIEASKDGVEVLGDYNLTINKKITDNRIYSVLQNGYPNKTPKELGVNNAGEAFLATKQAIYTLIYDRDTSQYSGVDSDAGRRTYAAYKQIVANAKKYPYQEFIPKLEIKEISEWITTDDNKYLEKEFKINTNLSNEKINLLLKNNDIGAQLIINNKIHNNSEVKNINKDSSIKLRVDIKRLDKAGKLKIELNSKVEKTIAYEAKPDISTAQKLAVIGIKETTDVLNNLNIDYYKNNTSLEIIKLDEEKEEPLSYVVFNIYGENNDLVFENVRTDKDGKIFLEGLLPGKYIIKEISTKEGYMLLDEEVEIELKYNETTKINILNKEIPEEPEEPEELEIPEEPEKPEEPKISVEPEEPKKIILPEKPKQPKKVLPLTGY